MYETQYKIKKKNVFCMARLTGRVQNKHSVS